MKWPSAVSVFDVFVSVNDMPEITTKETKTMSPRTHLSLTIPSLITVTVLCI